MKPLFIKGKLISWKEDRGFGFIKSNDGSSDVFLHISALSAASRRPKIGDIISYQKITTPKGKLRAAKASIQGISSSPKSTRSIKPSRPKSKPDKQLKMILGSIVLSIVGVTALKSSLTHSPDPVTAITQDPVTAITKPECKIKGNIAISTGKKLYHLPGMEDYASTTIRTEYGEKWFCTEAEAIENGWSKAPK